MVCPDDGRTLDEATDGSAGCGLCRGRLLLRAAFGSDSPHAAGLLSAETDPSSPGHARARRCPRCGLAMAPLRIGDQLAWLHACEPCGVLWLEKLVQPVVERLERRAA